MSLDRGLLQDAERLRDAVLKSKLAHPHPWGYTPKARLWAERAQKIVDDVAIEGETEAHRRAFSILEREVEDDADFQAARTLF